MPKAAPIFVSHCHEDNGWCRSFVNRLRLSGADVWYDEHNLGYGALQEEIERELRIRPIFIVILSTASVDSAWVRREVNAAISLKDERPERIVLPVVADKCEVPLLWREYKRISGPGDTGLPAAEAAGRIIHNLALTPAGTVTAHNPSIATETANEAWERSKSLLAQARYQDALTANTRATTLDPVNPSYWITRASILTELLRPHEALDAIRRAKALGVNEQLEAVANAVAAGSYRMLERWQARLKRSKERYGNLDDDDLDRWYQRGHDSEFQGNNEGNW